MSGMSIDKLADHHHDTIPIAIAIAISISVSISIMRSRSRRFQHNRDCVTHASRIH